MPKRKCDITIGHRMAEELLRLFPDQTNIAITRRLGCDRRALHSWGTKGDTPSTFLLARLHYLGGDVIYVLTGKRHALVRSIAVHSTKSTTLLHWTPDGFKEDLP